MSRPWVRFPSPPLGDVGRSPGNSLPKSAEVVPVYSTGGLSSPGREKGPDRRSSPFFVSCLSLSRPDYSFAGAPKLLDVPSGALARTTGPGGGRSPRCGASAATASGPARVGGDL